MAGIEASSGGNSGTAAQAARSGRAGQSAGQRDGSAGRQARPGHESPTVFGVCFYCGAEARTRDHVFPRQRGSFPLSGVHNLRAACHECNVGRAEAGHCHAAWQCARIVGAELDIPPLLVQRLWGWSGAVSQRRACVRLGIAPDDTVAVQRRYPVIVVEEPVR